MATRSDEKIRDGKAAVLAATKACELTNWKNDSATGTLSAAYAAAGDFQKAIEFLDKAIALVPDSHMDIRDEMRKAYSERRPYIEDSSDWRKSNAGLMKKPYFIQSG